MGKLIRTVLRGLGSGNVPWLPDQTIETKARFIEQIMSGTLHQRRIDDVSEFVLSAAEVKAIASGNPLVLRKVALELELSRMERVRAVHERTQYDLRRQRQWLLHKQAEDRQVIDHLRAALAAITESTSFRVELCRSLRDERQRTMTKRADADTAIRALLTEADRTTRAQQATLTQRIGSYRGTEIWLKTDAFVGVGLWLAFNGTHVSRLATGPERSVFRSADAQLREIDDRIRKLEQEQATRTQEVAAVDAELARLAEWGGQAAYDAAAAELTAINVQFAEVDAVESASGSAPATDAPAGAAPAPEEGSWGAEVHRLAVLGADDGTLDESLVILPPATESLAFMAEAIAQQATTVVAVPVPPGAEQLAAHGDPIAVIVVPPRMSNGRTVLPHAPQQFAWDF